MIQKITTNYRGLDIENLELSPINIIVGKNGSGKTRFLNSIKFFFETEIEKDKDFIESKTDILISNDLYKILHFDFSKEKNISTVGEFASKEFLDENLSNLLFEMLGLKEQLGLRNRGNFMLQTYIENSKLYIAFPGFNKQGNLHKQELELSQGTLYILNLFKELYDNLKKFNPNECLIVLIDEIENHLHPKAQKELIKHIYCEIVARIKNIQFIISTHSLFVIREALNYHKDNKLSIYHLENKTRFPPIYDISEVDLKEQFQKSIQDVKAFDEVLRELGFEMKDLFYPNCLIFVEGPTDIMYLRFWLEKYMEKMNCNNSLIQGLDYDFVEFGGALASHLSLKFNESINGDDDDINVNQLVNIFSLNRRVFVMVDNDKNNAFEKTKIRLESEISNINNGSIFYRNPNYVTIEDIIPENLKHSKDENKVKKCLINIKKWREKNVIINDFSIDDNNYAFNLAEKVYNFILNKEKPILSP